MPASSLNRALDLMAAKRIVDVATPLSTRPSRETRYSVGDPHLRFWLAFLGEHMAEIERGRGDLLVRRIKASWSSWQGAAIEPVIREALRRIIDNLPGDMRAVGGYLTRTNDPEIDLVGADRAPIAQRISFVVSVKWRDSHSFDSRDLAELIVHRSQLPGADESTPLLAISRAGIAVDGPVALLPEDLLVGAGAPSRGLVR